MKAGELDSRQRIDLTATIASFSGRMDPTMGFEKYQKGEGKWVVDELENGLKLEIEHSTENLTVAIRIYSAD
ncbi:hypothetical protein AAVH_27359 [Aphelenchoides avenae]|nr:hypothetical protein AAVH_27359 [Aphelenchus avenae]